MSAWNGLDFFIFLLFAANTIRGMIRGATKEIVGMMCLSVALIFTLKFTIPLTNFFNQSPLIGDVVDSTIIQNFMEAVGLGPATPALLYQMFYSISLMICFMFPYSFCEGALSLTGVYEVYTFPYMLWNRKVGGALGCVRGYVFTLILVSILSFHLFIDDRNTSLISNSYFVNLFQDAAQTLDRLISEQKPERYQEIYKAKDLFKANQVLENMGTELLPSGSMPPEPIPAAPVLPATSAGAGTQAAPAAGNGN
ncbi:MAG: hypothetical protein A3F43_02575 [Gammaproteobacteria bacterium RIFCSPHIGHO2_12_FULL_42_10]|nr:MAG: hypothetical protein A3F43_02575 [Gammaproteobacteria bacterium RIFCSPHIGHO2_12_FULL_42_10]